MASTSLAPSPRERYRGSTASERRNPFIPLRDPVLEPPNDWPARVTWELEDGARVARECLSAKGGPNRPSPIPRSARRFESSWTSPVRDRRGADGGHGPHARRAGPPVAGDGGGSPAGWGTATPGIRAMTAGTGLDRAGDGRDAVARCSVHRTAGNSRWMRIRGAQEVQAVWVRARGARRLRMTRERVVLYENLRACSYTPFYLAHVEGPFEAKGLEVEMRLAPDPSETVRGLIEGRADVAFGGPMRVMMHHDAAHRAGENCPLVCFGQVVARDPFVLVGRTPNPGQSGPVASGRRLPPAGLRRSRHRRARSSRRGPPDGPCDTAPRCESSRPPRDRKGPDPLAESCSTATGPSRRYLGLLFRRRWQRLVTP